MLFTLLSLLLIGGVGAGFLKSTNLARNLPLLRDATVEVLADGLSCGDFTSVHLVKAYLARIAEVNGTLEAVTEVNPDALSIASDLDRERSKGVIRGPLHGIPILLKNNIATNDEMNNTAGSWALAGAKVPWDSTVAKKLRAAGAILLGKTNLSQWANWRSLNASDGWSALGGQVLGPYIPNEDAEGSSSGSAVASALGLALGSFGTETDGSLTLPGSFNNLVGIKPTVGLTSRHLVIPISEHLDTVGPLARTVKDAAYLLQAIAGTDPRDNYTSIIPDGVVPDYISACDNSTLSGTRLGIPRNVISLLSTNITGPITEAFERTLELFRAAGATIVEDTNFTAAAEFLNSKLQTVILGADFVVNIHEYLESLRYNPENITTLSELRDLTQSFPLEDFPTRDTGRWDQSLDNWNNTDARFWPAYQQLLYYGGEGGLLGAIERNDLDAVIMPTLFAPDWAAGIGSPIVTVPLGFFPAGTPVVNDSWGLTRFAPDVPFGISFLGPKFTETKLIGMAYAFEQMTMVRSKVEPYLVPHTELQDVVAR